VTRREKDRKLVWRGDRNISLFLEGKGNGEGGLETAPLAQGGGETFGR